MIIGIDSIDSVDSERKKKTEQKIWEQFYKIGEKEGESGYKRNRYGHYPGAGGICLSVVTSIVCLLGFFGFMAQPLRQRQPAPV